MNAKQIALRRELKDGATTSADARPLVPFSLQENATFLKAYLEIVFPHVELAMVAVKALLRQCDGDINRALVELKREAESYATH